MLRATLDSNVLVSAFLVPAGPSARIVDLGASGCFELCLSDVILAEFEDVVRRPHIGRRYRVTEDQIHRFLLLLEPGTTVTIDDPPRVVADDPRDDHVVACAVLTGSDVIVTGDRHLLDLERHQGVGVVRPAHFLADLLSWEGEAPAEP